MTIEKNTLQKIQSLIEESQQLKHGNENRQVRSEDHRSHCYAWITAAAHIVQLVVVDPSDAYRKMAEEYLAQPGGYAANQGVGQFGAILEYLVTDIEQGLLTSIADRARAETFDNFLDHAKAYQSEGKWKQSGVIAGVVFEDCLRRVCGKNGIEEAGRKLEDLINDLARGNIITQAKAKRAKVAAHVRIKATHAQWDEFDENEVKVAIDLSEELIMNHLDK